MSELSHDARANIVFEFVFKDTIKSMDVSRGFRLAQELETDIISRLPGDLAQFDKRYLRLAKRSQARLAGAVAGLSAHGYRNYMQLSTAFDERASLFPEIQKNEQRDVLSPLVGRVALDYVRGMTSDLYLPKRFHKPKFLLDDGSRVSADAYVQSQWTPQYVSEVIAAHEMRLRSDVSQSAGAEAESS